MTLVEARERFHARNELPPPDSTLRISTFAASLVAMSRKIGNFGVICGSDILILLILFAASNVQFRRSKPKMTLGAASLRLTHSRRVQ